MISIPATTRAALRALWLPLISTLLFLLLAKAPAFAHASVTHTEPAAGAVLSDPPRQIRLEFSEPIEAEFNAIVVYNSAGVRMESGRATVDPRDANAILLPMAVLPRGVYTVSWRVTSADGHPIEGAFGFAVGPTAAGMRFVLPPPAKWKVGLVPAAAIAHSLAVTGLLLLFGTALFFWLVFDPVARTDIALNHRESGLRTMLYYGAVLAVSGSFLSLIVQALRVGGDFSLPTSPTFFYRLVAGTRFGQMWGFRMAGVVVALVAMRWALPNRDDKLAATRRFVFVLLAAVVLLTPTLAGHPAAEPGVKRVWLVLADWLHLLAAAPWVSGLAAFVLLIPRIYSIARADAGIGFTVRLVTRFPRLAVASVALLVASGLVGAFAHVPSWQGLLHTPYGKVLLAKCVLLLPVIGLAASHHLWSRSRVVRSVPSATTKQYAHALATFRRAVRVEFVLVLIILLLAGFLVNLPPAAVSLATSPGTGFDQIQHTSGVDVRLRIQPARVGPNTLDVELASGLSPLGAGEAHVTANAAMLAHDMGPQEVVLREVGGGQFRSDEVMFGMEGPWSISITGVLKDGSEIATTFRIYVAN